MIDTPIAGLVKLALRDPTLGDIARRAAAHPPELALVGPAGARAFVASALAQDGPLLVVTATDREADDLTAELKGVFGDSAALFPSWETLPHERLSPGVDTVGARMMVLRRLAHPDDERLGPPRGGWVPRWGWWSPRCALCCSRWRRMWPTSSRSPSCWGRKPSSTTSSPG